MNMQMTDWRQGEQVHYLLYTGHQDLEVKELAQDNVN